MTCGFTSFIGTSDSVFELIAVTPEFSRHSKTAVAAKLAGGYVNLAMVSDEEVHPSERIPLVDKQ